MSFLKKSSFMNQNQSRSAKKRSLRVEALEDRQMLTVTGLSAGLDAAGFEAIQAAYPELNLGDFSQYQGDDSQKDLYILTATELANLKSTPLDMTFQEALTALANGTEDDVIVIIPDATTPTLNVETTLSVASAKGSLTILAWGEGSFALNANESGNRVFSITDSKVNLAGFTLTNDDGNAETNGSGGGIYVTSSTANASVVNLVDMTIEKSASNRGGAVEMAATNAYNSSTLNASRTSFVGNRATAGQGGAVFQERGTTNFTSVLFAGNSASQQGGAIAVANAGAGMTIVNATVVNNSSSGTNDAAIYNNSSTSSILPVKKVYNSVFSGNSGNRDVFFLYAAGSTAEIANNIANSSSSFVAQGVDLGTNAWGTVVLNADFSPMATSLNVINKGNNTYIGSAALDLAGNTRIYGNTVDLGAFELQTVPFVPGNDSFDFVIDMSGTAADNTVTPVLKEINGTLYWTLSLNVLDNDSRPADAATKIEIVDNIASEENGFVITNEDGTVTYAWNYNYTSGDEKIVFTYKIGPDGVSWSQTATVEMTLGYASENAPIVVTTKMNSGTGSLRAALALADAQAGDDVIFFAPNLMNQTITLTSALQINSNVEIVGLGASHLAINGGAYSVQIFSINESTASISGMTLKNGTTAGNGGAVSAVLSDVTLSEMVFSGNKALNGGAIYTYKGSMNVENSQFLNNSAAQGGAMFVHGLARDGNTTTVSASSFDGNTASSSGGAIFIGNQNTSDVALNDVSFGANVALRGGAVYQGGNSSTTVAESSFTGNRATQYGGGAYFASQGTLVFTDVQFDENYSRGSGGAIYSSNGSLTLVDSGFNENTAVNGGAIARQGFAENEDFALLKNVAFESNKAKTGAGGAIFLLKDSTETVEILENSTFTSNEALRGGAIYQAGQSSLDIKSATFTANQASQFSGGAIFALSGNLALAGANFVSNTAKVNGGAVYFGSAGNAVISDSVFEKSAAQRGAALCFYDGTAEIADSLFGENAATLFLTAPQSTAAYKAAAASLTVKVADTVFQEHGVTDKAMRFDDGMDGFTLID